MILHIFSFKLENDGLSCHPWTDGKGFVDIYILSLYMEGKLYRKSYKKHLFRCGNPYSGTDAVRGLINQRLPRAKDTVGTQF